MCLGAEIAVSPADAQAPRPAVRIDPVDGIVEAFKTHQVVMLPGGHGSKQFHDLLLAVVRDPRMPGTLTDIVVEFGSSRYQDLIDRFMRGDAMPDATIRQAWQNTAIAGMANDGPYVEEFYRAMRELNAPLPVDEALSRPRRRSADRLGSTSRREPTCGSGPCAAIRFPPT